MIESILQTWIKGGWVMLPLAAVSLLMFITGLRLIHRMRRWPDRWGTEADWQKWVADPDQAAPAARVLLKSAGAEEEEESLVRRRFAAVSQMYGPTEERQLALLSTLVAAGPLVGLLGTVTGMLVTFRALAEGGGGRITEAMASGISQALFPPEVGLCIALPGLMMVHWARRRRRELQAFLAWLECLLVRQVRARHKRARVAELPVSVQA